jgi:hypothetical protein
MQVEVLNIEGKKTGRKVELPEDIKHQHHHY